MKFSALNPPGKMRVLLLFSRIRKTIATSPAEFYRRCLSSELGVKIQAQPSDLMVDERFTVKVSGLRPREKVTVKATVHEGNIVFTGLGHYAAGANGAFDVTSQESIGGTYTGMNTTNLRVLD